MSFLDRSVPLKYVILGAIAIAVFSGMSVHELQNRSDSMAHYGPALPAKVIKADDPKTIGGIFGLWGSTYTNTEVEVTPPSGQPSYYNDVPLDGSVAVGDELKAWFYDGSSNSASFENWFETSSKEAFATPWPSVEGQLAIAFFWTVVATGVAAFVILRLLSPKKSRKRSRPTSSRRKPAAM